MPHIDTHWFQSQLADRRLSQRKLAQLMGVDPGAVSLMINGKRRMTMEEAAEIARLLHVDVTEVMTKAGVSAPKTAAPVSVRGDWEAEFMRKWLDLGLHLLRNRGP